jgi:hypothetical protein
MNSLTPEMLIVKTESAARARNMFLCGIVLGALLCAAGVAPYLLAARRHAADQSVDLAACTTALGHATKKIAAYESGWTLVYDRQERPAVQVLHGFGQIGFGAAAVPDTTALRFAVPAHIPVFVSGETKGAQFVYYDPATHVATAPYTPMQFQPAAMR